MSEKETFVMKPEHLKLLRNFRVGWQNCEFGAPEINPKRPYGNSDVIQDMIEIFGLKTLKEGVYEFSLFGKKWLLKGEDEHNLYMDGADEEKLVKMLENLHKETEIALQIVLLTGQFKERKYEKDEYSFPRDWHEIQ